MKIDKKQLQEKAVTHGKSGFALAVKFVILYIVLTIVGLFGGGFGAFYGAAHFGYDGWWGILAAILGVAAGGIGGFILAQVIVIGIVQDMLLDAGIEVGKTGWRAAMKKLDEKRALKNDVTKT